MIRAGDLITHKTIGGLGLVKKTWEVNKSNGVRATQVHQAKIEWLVNPYDGGGYTVLWLKLLKKSEPK